MSKIFVLLTFLIVVALTVGSVSAVHFCDFDCSEEYTAVGGTIYQDTVDNGIQGASVEVTCNGNTETATSDSEGAYSVVFEGDECSFGDDVTVHAEKDGATGSNDGSVDMTYHYDFGCFCGLDLNVGIVNVPLIPEFGLMIGTLTAISAIGIFLFVRKK